MPVVKFYHTNWTAQLVTDLGHGSINIEYLILEFLILNILLYASGSWKSRNNKHAAMMLFV